MLVFHVCACWLPCLCYLVSSSNRNPDGMNFCSKALPQGWYQPTVSGTTTGSSPAWSLPLQCPIGCKNEARDVSVDLSELVNWYQMLASLRGSWGLNLFSMQSIMNFNMDVSLHERFSFCMRNIFVGTQTEKLGPCLSKSVKRVAIHIWKGNDQPLGPYPNKMTAIRKLPQMHSADPENEMAKW